MASGSKLDRIGVLRPVERAIDIADGEKHRNEQCRGDPQWISRFSHFAARHCHHYCTDKPGSDTADPKCIGTPQPEPHRQNKRDDRRQRVHDAGKPRAKARNGGKNEEIGHGIGDKRGTDIVTQSSA